MLRLIARRIVTMVPTLLGVVLISMLLLDLMPGDPAAIIAGDQATPQAIAAVRHDLRLDEPLWVRGAGYLWGLAHGDLGTSPGGHIPVWSRISVALPVTLSLCLLGMVLGLALGILAGTYAALRRGRLLDRVIVATASVAQAVPPFVLGLGLVIALAVDRPWFPVSGYVPLTENPQQWFVHLVLPSTALALSVAAEIARQTRGALIDTLEQDFIRAGRAKGLSEFRLIGKHAAKNTAIPVVTVTGLQVARILAGAVVVERIFGLNGFGSLAVNAVLSRDVVLIQGVVLVSATFVLITNLLVDLSYGYLNPKVRA